MFHDITVSVAPGLRRDHAQIDLEALPAKVVMFTVKLAMQATSPCSGETGGITARAGDTGFRKSSRQASFLPQLVRLCSGSSRHSEVLVF
tara:strand:- start:1107 stop:1376 length:270 start_codon:yes stop_codon:yes gene_type:complete